MSAPPHPPRFPRRSELARWGAAVIASALAFGLGAAFCEHWHLNLPFTTFYLALVTAVAAYAGLGPGLLCSIACTAAMAYYWMEPAGFAVSRPSDVLAAVLFLAIGGFISLMSERLRQSAKREALARSTAEHEAEAAKRARAARERILAVVAHDLRNPLGVIDTGAAAIAIGTAQGADRADITRRVGIIRRAVARMDRLIRDLLDWAMIDLRKLPIYPAPEAIGSLLAEVVEVCAGEAAAKQIHCEVAVVDPALWVRCDRQRVLQALSNLIDNAVKFTPRGGVVTLRAEPEGAWVSFAVSDTGPGIPADAAAHVFEWLWHQESAAGGGTGLGLSITKGIVEAHGGTIAVETAPHRGATFRFTLPRVMRHP